MASVVVSLGVSTPASATPTPPSGCQFIPGGVAGRWSGEGSALDSAGANHGTLVNGATFAPGRVGRAFHFDGVNDYVQVGAPPSLAMGAAVTVAAWIRPTVNVSGIIVNKEGEYEIARFPDGTIRWAFANPTSWFGLRVWQWNNTHAVAPLNAWTHVAVVYDSTKVTTFVDGVAVNSVGGSVPSGNTATLGDLATGQNDFRFGGRQGESQFFAGEIDEVTVWDQPLSPLDVAALATTGLSGERVQSRPTVRVDFDTLPGGAPTALGQAIDDDYALHGVTFRLAETGAPAIVGNATFPGGVRALAPTVDASLTSSTLQDVVLEFAVPVARVSLASGDTDEPWTLLAYAGDTLVASATPAVSGDIAVATAVASAPAATGWITRAVVDLTQAATDASGPEYFDLLQFDVADNVAPSVDVTSMPDANGAGWNDGPVTVALLASDVGGAGFYDLAWTATGASSLGAAHDGDGAVSVVMADEGTTTVSFSAVDCQGNAAYGSYVVRIDMTAPMLTFSGNSLAYAADDDIAITCEAADTISGVASDTCVSAIGPAWSFGVGSHTLTATATDVAGNQATSSTTFVVTVDPTSLCALSKRLVTNPGIAGSLCAKLSAASAARTPQARAGQIDAFRRAVAAQSGKALTAGDAVTLDGLALAL